MIVVMCVYVHEQEKEYMVNQVHIEQLREEIKEHTQECEVVNVLTAVFIITFYRPVCIENFAQSVE